MADLCVDANSDTHSLEKTSFLQQMFCTVNRQSIPNKEQCNNLTTPYMTLTRYNYESVVKTIKNGRLGLSTAVWLQAKVRERGIGLQPRLNRVPVCDYSAAEAAYVYKRTLPFTFTTDAMRIFNDI